MKATPVLFLALSSALLAAAGGSTNDANAAAKRMEHKRLVAERRDGGSSSSGTKTHAHAHAQQHAATGANGTSSASAASSTSTGSGSTTGAGSATPADVAGAVGQAVAQFVGAQLVPSPIQAGWLQPVAGLTITYDGKAAPLGSKQEVKDIQSRPIYSVQYASSAAADAAVFAAGAKFTIMFVDASFVGDGSTGGNVTRHYLGNDYVVNAATGALESGTPITRYGAPLPKAGDPAHRYVQLVWAQPPSFSAPAYPPKGAPIESWDLASYVSAAGLQHVVAMSYVQVQQGSASASVATQPPAAATVSAVSASVLNALTGGASPAATSAPAGGSADTKKNAASAPAAAGAAIAAAAAFVAAAQVLL